MSEKRKPGRPPLQKSAAEYESDRRKQFRQSQQERRARIRRLEIELSNEDFERLEAAAKGTQGGKKAWVTGLVLAHLNTLFPPKGNEPSS